MLKMKKSFKKHIPFLLLILVIALVYMHPFLSSNASYHHGDWRISHQNTLVIMDKALDDGTLPLWTNLVDSGMPFYAIPDKPFLYPPLLLLLWFFGAVFAMNILVVAHMAIAGLFMYLLAFHLFQNRYVALGSALIFMLSSINLMHAPFWRYSTAWIPLLMYFVIRAFESKDKRILFSVLAGTILALQALAGGIFIFYYPLLFLVILFLIFKWMLAKNKVASLFSVLMIFFILFGVFLGFSLVRLAPSTEWSNLINRASGLDVEQSKGTTLSSSDVFTTFISGNAKGYYRIGFLGTIFVLCAFCFFRKKEFFKNNKNKLLIFFILVMFINLIFATGLFYEFFWKIIPGLNKQRHLIRSLFVYVFCASIVAGYGLLYLFTVLKKRIGAKPFKILFVILLALLVVDMLALSNVSERYPDLEDYNIVIDNNPLAQYLSTQEKPFRIHVFEVRGIDYTNIEIATIPLNVEETSHAFGGFWFNDYLHGFMSLAYQGDYAKIMGVLNVKYISSSKEINISGLDLYKVLPEYDGAIPDFIDGPYLYNNTKAVSRAFYPENKVLVVGDSESAKQIVRVILLQDSFNTSNTVVVRSNKDRVSEFNYDFLSGFDVVVLGKGSVESNVPYSLKKYVEEGGILLPNLIEGENSISAENLAKEFSLFSGSNINVDASLHYSQNSLLINNPSPGWLVLSERYALFPGWRVRADGTELDIFQADGIISAVNVPSNVAELEFVYSPKFFVSTFILFILTTLFVVVYLLLFWRKSSKQ